MRDETWYLLLSSVLGKSPQCPESNPGGAGLFPSRLRDAPLADWDGARITPGVLLRTHQTNGGSRRASRVRSSVRQQQRLVMPVDTRNVRHDRANSPSGA